MATDQQQNETQLAQEDATLEGQDELICTGAPAVELQEIPRSEAAAPRTEEGDNAPPSTEVADKEENNCEENGQISLQQQDKESEDAIAFSKTSTNHNNDTPPQVKAEASPEHHGDSNANGIFKGDNVHDASPDSSGENVNGILKEEKITPQSDEAQPEPGDADLIDAIVESATQAIDEGTSQEDPALPDPEKNAIYREITEPIELEAIVQQNPVLRDIRAYGAQAKREDVYPSDSTADYVFDFLRHFPPNCFAVPQTFRKVIKGLHAGHWLSKKIEEIKNRRWREQQKNVLQWEPDKPDYGKLSEDEVAKIQRCNMAFWELYIQKKPPEEVLKKRQEQYNKKTAHNKTARALSVERKPVTPSTPPAVRPEAKSDIIYTKLAPSDSTDTHETTLVAVTGPSATEATTSPEMLTEYTEIIDPTAIERLEAIVKTNPVLLKVREYGPTAKREDVYPANNTLESEEYVFTYLRSFPENTFALPQVFRKVVKGLNSSHWLAKKVDELKNRRWRRVEAGEYGRLTPEEVHKIKSSNIAFWECFMQKKPPDEVLRKKQAQYDKKTANVKQARTARPEPDAAAETKLDEDGKEEKKNTAVARNAEPSGLRHHGASTYTELVDPTAVGLLEEIVQSNPVLSKIRECGSKAKREDVYPTSTTLQAETYVYTYLKNFPENTYALPPTFRKVVRGLNASHWLAKKVIEMKDRRWRLRDGQESEYGRMSPEEVEKIKSCNPAFWECYINKKPPADILNKKRKQYERKTEHNKNARATKKPKEDGDSGDGDDDEEGTTEGLSVPVATESVVPLAEDETDNILTYNI